MLRLKNKEIKLIFHYIFYHITHTSFNFLKIVIEILHITPSSNGYQKVKLLANRLNKTISLAVIEINGVPYMTGGYLINDTPEIRKILDNISPEGQYEFVKSFKNEPFASFYYEEEFENDIVR